ncbi:hypothetical protein QQ045_000437 [Rhodiola kirilowii]
MDGEQVEDVVDSIADKFSGKVVVSLEEDDWRSMAEEGKWAFVVQLANRMLFNLTGLSNVLSKIWGMENRVYIVELANNMAQVRFRSERDMKKIRDGGPWLCMNSFILMHDWCPDLALEEFNMNRLGVWAQLHNLPVGAALKDKEPGEKLAKNIGRFVMVSQSELEASRKRYIRVRVEVEIDKPLVTSFYLNRRNREPLWVTVKFERLPEVCSKCGRLSHETNNCSFTLESFSTQPIEALNEAEGSAGDIVIQADQWTMGDINGD